MAALNATWSIMVRKSWAGTSQDGASSHGAMGGNSSGFMPRSVAWMVPAWSVRENGSVGAVPSRISASPGSELTNSVSKRAGTVARPGSTTWATTHACMATSRLVAESLSIPSWVSIRTWVRTGIVVRPPAARPMVANPALSVSCAQTNSINHDSLRQSADEDFINMHYEKSHFGVILATMDYGSQTVALRVEHTATNPASPCTARWNRSRFHACRDHVMVRPEGRNRHCRARHAQGRSLPRCPGRFRR